MLEFLQFNAAWIFKIRTSITSAVIVAVVSCSLVHAQDSPAISAASLQVAEGFEVSLWASEPMVNNPTAMDIDSRGRVWIAEGLNYRMSTKRHETLKRSKDADRIKILADTNGDGRADSVKVFADNIFPVPLGLAVEEIWKDGHYRGARVYVGNAPDLLVLEDTDGDDRADRRYPLLTGFHGIDSDHGLHGMALGIDGKLYFTQGDARYGADKVSARDATFDVRDKSGRRVSASNFGTTLRVDLDGTNFEVLAYGQRNNYETSIDSFGNIFTSDNDDDGDRGCRTIWIMPGGTYGYHDPRSSRHWAEELPGIIPKIVGTGNGAPCGLTVYEGDLFPPEYFHSLLQADAGTHQVNVHPLKRHGAGFRSDYQVLLKSDDAWFRPVDVAVAHDGSVYVCDWYDAGVGGNRFSDQTTGRLYWLRPTDSDGQTKPHQVDFTNVDGLIEALRSPNVATRFAARQSLVARGDSSRAALQKMFAEGRPHERARALYVLAALPDTGQRDVVAAIKDDDARLRETALEILARDVSRESVVETNSAGMPDPPAMRVLSDILPLADDPDASVRRALLMALRNVPTKEAGSVLTTLAMAWDGRDRYYLEAVRAALKDREPEFLQSLFDRWTQYAIREGWGDETIAVPPYFPIATNDAFLRPDDQLPPSNTAAKIVGLAWGLERAEALSALRLILDRNNSSSVEQAAYLAISRIEDPRAGELLIARYFAAETDRQRQRELLKRLGAGISGAWKSLASSEKLRHVIGTALQQDALQIEAINMIARGAIDGYDQRLLEIAKDESADRFTRAAAIKSLGELRYEPIRQLALQLVEGAKGQTRGGQLSLAAVVALRELLGTDALRFLTNVIADSRYPLNVRRRSLQTVAATSAGVVQILKLYRSGGILEDLLPELIFLLHNHPDRSVRAKAATEMPIPEKESGKHRHDIQAVLAMQSNAQQGQAIFHRNKDTACSRCHRVQGEGSWVGPDLSSIGTKYGRKELLYHILNPSGAINYNYVAHTFLLDDGRVLNGLIVDRRDGTVVLKTATGERTTFAEEDIEEQEAQNVSLMPQDLVAKLTQQELADLVDYLSTLRKPVSTATQYYLLGPLPAKSMAAQQIPDLQSSWDGVNDSKASWHRVAAESDGHLDLSSWVGSKPQRVVLCYLPVNSPSRQNTRIVIDSESPLALWHDGHTVATERRQGESTSNVSSAKLSLHPGVNHVVIQLFSGSDIAEITTSIISDRELSYSVVTSAASKSGKKP